MKAQFKIILRVIGIIGFVGFLYLSYFWLTYINETIIAGEGYGFNIGEAKEQVFSNAIKAFQEEQVYILNPIDERGYGPHEEIEFTSEDYELLKNRNKWDFYYSKNYFDSIKLTFEQDILVEIHRHRKKFELP